MNDKKLIENMADIEREISQLEKKQAITLSKIKDVDKQLKHLGYSTIKEALEILDNLKKEHTKLLKDLQKLISEFRKALEK